MNWREALASYRTALASIQFMIPNEAFCRTRIIIMDISGARRESGAIGILLGHFAHGWIRGEYGKTTIGLFISSLPMEISDVGWENRATDLPSYSDTLGTRGKVSL